MLRRPPPRTQSDRGDCGCSAPPRRRGMLREQVSREYVSPTRPRSVEPVEMVGVRGAKCRPFLKVEKDPEGFAACNALADQIGPLDSPKKAFQIIEEAIGDEVNEVFGVMLLDIHTRFKGLSITGRGEPASVMAPMMPTLQVSLINGADSVIIFHVHPSGVEAEPSKADKDTTKAFVKAFETVGVPLLDHIIVGGDFKRRSYYSFAEDGAI